MPKLFVDDVKVVETSELVGKFEEESLTYVALFYISNGSLNLK